MSESTGDQRVFFNGIDYETGNYLTAPMPVEQVAKVAMGQKWTQEQLDELNFRAAPGATEFAVMKEYGDGSDLQKVGWGILFPATAADEQVDAILQAMDPLISLRRSQVGKNANQRFRILRGKDGFRWKNGKPETRKEFLERHGVGDGPVDPTRFPFYLLIVGDPQSIPFQFQFELDVQFAVGRIYFPRLEDYARYAQSVADAESGKVSLARKAVFFGTAHKGDEATEASAENLIKPLHEYMNTRSAEFELGWSAQLVEPKEASRSTLMSLLGGSQTPAFLFTASHGMSLPYNHPQQGRFQGALMCQDWPGPGNKVGRQHFVTGEDLAETSNLAGSIVFHFACFGAGTPYWDEFAISENRERGALAVRPFLSPLPMRLLSNPGGGALAVIGHVERAWTHSFSQGKLKSQTQAYQSLLFQMMDGKPIGMAMDDMNIRYAQIASTLAYNLGELKYDKNFISQYELALQWASTNDARGYAILGDPAVKVAVGATGTPKDTRPAITLAKQFKGALPVVFTPEALDGLNATERQQAQTETQALQQAHGSFSIMGGVVEIVESEKPAEPEKPAAAKKPRKRKKPAVEEVYTPPGEKSPLGVEEQPAGPAGQVDLDDLIMPGVQVPGGATPPRQPLDSERVTLPGAGATGGSIVPRQQVEEPVTPGGGVAYLTPVDALARALQDYDSDQPASFAGNIIEDAREKVKLVVVGLNNALLNLAQNMETITRNTTTLTVTTGVIEDLKNFDPKTADPRFITTISLDGDVQVYVPRVASEMDETLLALHREMVNQAMANRLAFIKALGETITTLFAGPKS